MSIETSFNIITYLYEMYTFSINYLNIPCMLDFNIVFKIIFIHTKICYSHQIDTLILEKLILLFTKKVMNKVIKKNIKSKPVVKPTPAVFLYTYFTSCCYFVKPKRCGRPLRPVRCNIWASKPFVHARVAHPQGPSVFMSSRQL